MIVLDSNVISAMMRQPDKLLIAWLDTQPQQSLWTTSISVYEIEYGLQALLKGKRRQGLQKDFERAMQEDLEGRILDFDHLAAKQAAAISAHLRSIGRPIDVRDAMIAGISLSRNATLVTRNVKHFDQTGVNLINPWDNNLG